MNKNLKRINFCFFGSGEFAKIVLEKILKKKIKPKFVVTQASRKKTTVKKFCEEAKIKNYELANLKEKKFINKLFFLFKKYEISLCLLSDFGLIIPKKILKFPKYGFLNIHPSLLPKYRGPTPIQSAILAGEKQTGLSIILMDEKVDHGPILAKEKLKMENEKLNYVELRSKLANLGADLFIEILPKWIKGKIKLKIQDEKEATYTKILKKEDGKINWQNSADFIVRMIRAFYPFPTVFTFFNWKNKIKRLQILEARSEKQEEGIYEPGELFLYKGKEVAVQCKNSYLILEKVKLEGKKPMLSKDFINGYKKLIGQKFIF